jgi:hypothetical protein
MTRRIHPTNTGPSHSTVAGKRFLGTIVWFPNDVAKRPEATDQAPKLAWYAKERIRP